MMFRIACLFLSALALAGVTSCRSPELPPSGDLLTRLAIAPPSGDWSRMNRENTRLFFNPNNAITDEDLIILTVEGIQLPMAIIDIQDVIPILDLENSPDIVSTSVEEVAGTPVVRWHLHKLDEDGTPESILKHLSLRRRESRNDYFRRSKGIIMLHPDETKVGAVIRIGISRTSVHGLIGSHYEDVAVDFISRLVVENRPEDLFAPLLPER